MAGSARGGVPVSQADGGGGVENRNLSHVKEEPAPMPKDRGAEQGDVDGPWSAAWLWEWLRRGGNT